MSIEEYKGDKPDQYYSLEREDLIAGIPKGDHCVLEVGCAEGRSGKLLKTAGKARVVVGIELHPDVALRAQENLDYVIQGDLETIVIPEPFGKYNYILAGDVLEHLIDPWSALRKLKEVLAPNGQIYFSVPNIRNWTVIFPLLFQGKWDYQQFGIMDSTHLRFFTKRTCIQLAESADLNVLSITPAGSRIAKKFHRLHFSTLVELTAVQFVVVCEKL